MTHYLHIISGTMVNVYRKCENESIFWVLLTPMRLFLWKHSFIFHPLWTFHSRSSSKVNRANSPLPCIFHFALSTFALSRGSWTRILRSVRKSNKTECQDLFHVDPTGLEDRSWPSTFLSKKSNPTGIHTVT